MFSKGRPENIETNNLYLPLIVGNRKQNHKPNKMKHNGPLTIKACLLICFPLHKAKSVMLYLKILAGSGFQRTCKEGRDGRVLSKTRAG